MDIVIRTEQTLRQQMINVWDLVKRGIQAGPVVVSLGRVSKSRQQEEKYHEMIKDIDAKMETDKKYTNGIWKALLVDEYEQQLIGMGAPLTHPGTVVIALDGRRAVTVRPSTRKFKKHEASGFIQFLYAWGTEHGAKFSEKSIGIYREAA